MAVVVEASSNLLGGRYRIDELIGVGGMGRVYRGLHTGIRRPVAIKILSSDAGRARDAAERFQQEAFASGQLDHPNIVAVSDFGMFDDGELYLVMEVLEGESLAAKLAREGKLAWPLAIEIMRGILAGIQYAHDRDIVHCDLKPDNLFLASKHGEEVVKVLDFGIARLCASAAEHEQGLAIGTPAYLSPEQAVGAAITPASDVYSASVVLYELLAGRTPFWDVEPAAKLAAHVSRPPPPFDPELGVPAALEQLVMTGLAKTPSQRFASAAEFQERLDAVLRLQGLAPPPARLRLKTGPIAVQERPQLALAPTLAEQPVVTLTTPRVRMRKWAMSAGIAFGLAGLAIAAISQLSGHATAAVAPPALAPMPIAAAAAAVPVTVPVPVPTPPIAADPRLDIARAAIAAGRIAAPPGDNALELLAQIAHDRPADPRVAELRTQATTALRAAAEALWTHGKHDSAALLYAELARAVPDDAVAAERSQLPKAGSASGIASASTHTTPAANLARVRWLVSEIDLAIIERRFVAPVGHNALEALIELRRIDPGNDAVSRLGTEVASALEQAAKAEPAQAETLLAAAKQAAPVAPPKAAVPEHASNSADAARLVSEGGKALAAGRYDAAEALYEHAIAADSTSHAALDGLAEVAYNRGDFSRATLSAKRAVALAPRVLAYRMSLAKAYFKLLRYDDAVAQWQAALQLDPSNATAKSHIALARAKSGH